MTLRPRSNSVGARPLSAIPLSSSLLKLATEVWKKRATINHGADVYDLYSGIKESNTSISARTQALTDFFCKISRLGMLTHAGPYLQGFKSISFVQLALIRKNYINYQMPISNSFVRMTIIANRDYSGKNDLSPENCLVDLMDEEFFCFQVDNDNSVALGNSNCRVDMNVKVSCSEDLISAIDIISYVVQEIMVKINGIIGVKMAVSGRRDTIIIYTTNSAVMNQVIAKIQEYQDNNGVSGFNPEIPMMTQAQIYGVATASEPPQVTMIKGKLLPAQFRQSFGTLRSELIYDALKNSTGCSDFYELIVKNFREAGIDASQPAVQVHYNSCLWKAQRSFIDQVITDAANLPI